jgi:hypothetical protein
VICPKSLPNLWPLLDQENTVGVSVVRWIRHGSHYCSLWNSCSYQHRQGAPALYPPFTYPFNFSMYTGLLICIKILHHSWTCSVCYFYLLVMWLLTGCRWLGDIFVGILVLALHDNDVSCECRWASHPTGHFLPPCPWTRRRSAGALKILPQPVVSLSTLFLVDSLSRVVTESSHWLIILLALRIITRSVRYVMDLVWLW